eukprot:4699873-Pyramimonas_sp.AAC.1
MQGAPTAATPAGFPANDQWLRRIERATERSSHWLQVSHGYTPYGRPLRNQRRAESPLSIRSGTSAISERDLLHT